MSCVMSKSNSLRFFVQSEAQREGFRARGQLSPGCNTACAAIANAPFAMARGFAGR